MFVEYRSGAQIYRAYNEAENRHDLAGTTALVADNLSVTINGVASVSSGSDDERAMDLLYTCYPDYQRRIDKIIGEQNEIAVMWTMLGTANPNMPDLKPLEVSGVSIVESDGRVMTKAYLFVNSLALDEVLRRAVESTERK